MNKSFQIGNRMIGEGAPAFIVAEISANHNQDYNRALEIVHAAKEAGADAVKLQTYTADTITITAMIIFVNCGKKSCHNAPFSKAINSPLTLPTADGIHYTGNAVPPHHSCALHPARGIFPILS